MALNWRSQFNFDFIIYLILSSGWVVWREGETAKAYLYGFLNIFLGGIFGFPFLLLISFQANGDLRKILLGVGACAVMAIRPSRLSPRQGRR